MDHSLHKSEAHCFALLDNGAWTLWLAAGHENAHWKLRGGTVSPSRPFIWCGRNNGSNFAANKTKRVAAACNLLSAACFLPLWPDYTAEKQLRYGLPRKLFVLGYFFLSLWTYICLRNKDVHCTFCVSIFGDTVGEIPRRLFSKDRCPLWRITMSTFKNRERGDALLICNAEAHRH